MPAHVCAADLTAPGAIDTIAAPVQAAGGRLDVLINNAGAGDFGLFADTPADKLAHTLQLDVVALTLLSSLFVRDYHDTAGTQLINVSSRGGYTIVPQAVTYCAAKFYVSAFTEGLARELQAAGAKMQSKVLAPAATETEFGQVANGVEQYDYNQAFRKYHSSRQMAAFLLQLYDSDKTVGIVNAETFVFDLREPMFAYSGDPGNNQKNA